MSDTTPRSALPLLAAAQSQKHVTHNEALLEIDALTCCNILDRDLSTPPSTPADGATYLVKATGAGLWLGQDGKIAFAVDGAWRFYAPYSGLVAYVADEQKLIVFNGSAWVDYASLLALQNVPELGINATADTTNKLTVASAAVLFNNIGNGVQAKLNKHASADTASLLYQTNFSGRAEVGLTGDDNFHFKVSPDGSTFYEALILNRNTGSQLLKHVDISSTTTIGATHLGRLVRADATSGAFNVTLPATADADDWLIVRKKDSGANRVTVKDNSGNDLAWLSAQNDEVMFAFWDGAWAPVRWRIAPLDQVFTSSGTWTKPPLLCAADVWCFGGGGGGGSGRRGAAGSLRGGGGGGATGPIVWQHFAAAAMSSSVSIAVGAGGNGGAAVTSDDTNGNAGGIGGNSSFGSLLKADFQQAGAGGGTSSAGGSGGASNATLSTVPVAAGGTGGSSGSASGGNTAAAGGAGGGGGITAGNVVGNGGGGGAGTRWGNAISGGSAGTAGNVGGSGSDAAAGAAQLGGSGGGGGGADTGSGGKAGGAAGAPSGGGGGGGASLNGNASGAGGAGGRGEVRITMYF